MCSPTALTAAFAEPYSVVVNSFPQPLQMFTSSVVSSSQPALSCKVQGLSEKCTLDVNVTGADEKKTKSAVEFLKEVKDDAILSRYARLTLPAGSSVDFDFDIASSKACTVTVIPVMAQETVVYGEADSVSWEEKPSLLDNVIGFFTGDTPEKEIDVKVDDDIQIDDVQGISFDLSESLNADDFASMRLMVLSDDPSVFEGKNNVIGQYGNLYLMQFDSPEAAMQAYDYYKDIVTAVEPDISVEVASNVDADKEDVDTDTVNDDELDISTTEEQTSVNDSTVDETQDANPENNPINVLNSVDASTDVKKERGVIALIDTGVSEHANVIDRISVIDDDASGNSDSHGDVMVNAIVSQDPEAKILSIKAMDDNSYGTVSALVAAMEYAIEQKVSIINLSLYARTTLSTSVLKSEIEKATDAGIIVVGAAGNDGADVKDYVPGSVESAYIIGAAGKSGYRQVLSNYGETVDYNVVASSTSEAAALFTGFVSANGLDGVDKVLNQGLVFETGYGDGEDITIQDEDFSKYEVDESKSFLIRYTFADASKLKDDDTIDSLYLSDRYLDEVYAVLLVRPDVYDVGDGTYKVKLNSPMLNGAAVHGYMDVDFAHGNNGGHSVTDGISFDASTGIATIDASAFEHESDEDFADFSDLQAQVLIPVDDIRGQVIQNVTVVNSDGTEYTVRVPVHGLQNAVVPLALTGKDLDEELSVDDFDVYLNGNDVPETSFKWDDEKHTLVLDDCAMTTHSIKVVVKKEVDSLFRTAGPGDAWRGFTPAFRLKDGLSFSVGQRSQNNSLIMSSANHYEFTHGGVLHGEPAVIEPQMCRESRFSSTTSPARNTAIFSPRNVFGVNFTYLEPSDGSEMAGSLNYGGLWNVGIKSFCNHINTSLTIGPNEFVVPVDYTILDTWKSSGMTYYAMSMLMVKGAVGTDQAGVVQAAGGVVVFCVEDDTGDEPVNIKLSVKKLWDDDEDALGLQPGRVTVQLKQAKKEKGGDYNGWHDYGDEVVLKPDSWSHTWSKVPRVKQVDGKTMIYKYKVVEVDVPEGYQVEYKQFSLSGVGDGDTRKATITNEIKPIKIHLRAKKVWDDSSNKLKVRPKSIKFAL